MRGPVAFIFMGLETRIEPDAVEEPCMHLRRVDHRARLTSQ